VFCVVGVVEGFGRLSCSRAISRHVVVFCGKSEETDKADAGD
jgi:hypothetical protein